MHGAETQEGADAGRAAAGHGDGMPLLTGNRHSQPAARPGHRRDQRDRGGRARGQCQQDSSTLNGCLAPPRFVLPLLARLVVRECNGQVHSVQAVFGRGLVVRQVREQATRLAAEQQHDGVEQWLAPGVAVVRRRELV